MPRFSLTRLLPLAVLGLALFGPSRVLHAQDDDEGGPGAQAPKLDADGEKAYRDLTQQLNTINRELEGAGKDYAKSEPKFAEYVAKLEKVKLPKFYLDRLGSSAYYNYACTLAVNGKNAEAVKAFARSIECGYADWDAIAKDDDLVNIREEAGYKDAIAKAKQTEVDNAKKETTAALAAKPIQKFDFKVKTIDDKTLTLADLKGKVVIVDLWGTWCGPCKREIPDFVKLYETYKDKGLEIVGIAFERVEGEDAKQTAIEQVKKFAAENSMKYPLAARVLKQGDKIFDAAKSPGFPTTFFIDRDGYVRAKEVGLTAGPVLEAIVNVLLDAKPGAGKPGDEEPKKDEGKKEEPKKDDGK